MQKERLDEMLVKTKGIVLHQIKYTDSSVVLQVYTREYGRVAFIVRGIRNKKSGRHNALLQPMSVLEFVFYFRASGGVQLIKEFSVFYIPADIYSDIKKNAIGVFLGEFLSSVLKEETSHHELYDYLERSVIFLDECKTGFINFHISLLAGLGSYLGFEPRPATGIENKYFDLLNGTFVSIRPVHRDFADPEVSEIISWFFNSSYDRAGSIQLSGRQRNEVLETLIRYFSVHLPGLKKINSLEILREIFN